MVLKKKVDALIGEKRRIPFLDLHELQNKIKRDPRVYNAEFKQQLAGFEAQLAIHELTPATKEGAKQFGKLVTFLSHVSHLYTDDSSRLSGQVLNLLKNNYEQMIPDLRGTLFSALVLLKNRGQLDQLELIRLCFELFECKDKNLRHNVFSFVVQDLKSSNLISNRVKLNNAVMDDVRKLIKNENNQSLKGLQILIDLYKRRVITSSKCVNVIAEGVYCKSSKLVRLTVGFFLGIDEQIETMEVDEESQRKQSGIRKVGGEAGQSAESLLKKKVMGRHYSRMTRARQRIENKDVKALKKSSRNRSKASVFEPRFAAIELINDPDSIVDALFTRVRQNLDVFEARLNIMCLISRLISLHKVVFLPFFSYTRRFLQPHQQNVTQVLSFLAQACHDLIPPEIIAPEVKTIANNFVNDKTDSETMAVGLNSIREIIARAPLVTSVEGFDDLVEDLVDYKSYKKSKSVVMAARALLNLIREVNPLILTRKERGKDHDQTAKPAEYGEIQVTDAIEGTDLLRKDEDNSDDEVPIEQKMILSTEDFARIKRKQAQIALEEKTQGKKKKQEAKIAKIEFKNTLIKKLEQEATANGEVIGSDEEMEGSEFSESEDEFTDSSDDEMETESQAINATLGILNPHSLEGHTKQKRRNLAERLKVVYQGRDDVRQDINSKKGDRSAGTNNAQKTKGKNFMMVKNSTKVKRKQSQSLRQQQHLLKKHIKDLERGKKVMQKISKKRRQ